MLVIDLIQELLSSLAHLGERSIVTRYYLSRYREGILEVSATISVLEYLQIGILSIEPRSESRR